MLEEESEEHISAWRSPWLLSISGAGLVLLVIAGWLGWQRWEDHIGGPPIQAVLSDFSSNTGDAALDRTLEDALRIELAESPFVNVVSAATASRTLVEMSHKPDGTLTPALAWDICERSGSQVVLEGSIAKTGSHYLVTAQATSCLNGAPVTADHREAATAADLPAAMEKISGTLRHGLGESRRSIARFDTELSHVATPSLEALEDFSQASHLAQQGKFLEAISLLKQAVQIDPNFAAAWLDLANFSSNLSDFQAQREYIRKAYALRDHATEPTRRYITMQYNTLITGDLEQGIRDLEAWSDLYPRAIVPVSTMGELYRELEEHQKSAAAFQRAITLSPKYSVVYYGLASEQLASGDVSAQRPPPRSPFSAATTVTSSE